MQSAGVLDCTQREHGCALSHFSLRRWQGMHTKTLRLRLCVLPAFSRVLPSGSAMEKVEKKPAGFSVSMMMDLSLSFFHLWRSTAVIVQRGCEKVRGAREGSGPNTASFPRPRGLSLQWSCSHKSPEPCIEAWLGSERLQSTEAEGRCSAQQSLRRAFYIGPNARGCLGSERARSISARFAHNAAA